MSQTGFDRVLTEANVDKYDECLNQVLEKAGELALIALDVKDISSLVSDATDALSIAIAPLGGTPFVQAIGQFASIMEQFSTIVEQFSGSMTDLTQCDLDRISFSRQLAEKITQEHLDEASFD